MSKYHMNSYDVWLDCIDTKRNEIIELENKLEEINHNILDEFLFTGNEKVRDDLLQEYRNTNSELASQQRQLEYLNLMDKVKYNLLEKQLDKIKTQSCKKNENYRRYQDCKKMFL